MGRPGEKFGSRKFPDSYKKPSRYYQSLPAGPAPASHSGGGSDTEDWRTGWVLRGKRLDMISKSRSVHAVGHPLPKRGSHSTASRGHLILHVVSLCWNITVSVHDPQSGATVKLSELLNRIGTSCLLGWITSAEPSSGMCLCLGMHHAPGSRVYSSAQVWPTSAGHSFWVLCFLARLTWLTLAPQ